MADPWDSIIRDEQKVAKDRSKIQMKPRNVLPNLAVSPGLRERIISGLMSMQAAQAPIQAASRTGDPLAATMAGITGAVGAPSPQDLANAEQKKAQEAQMQALDMTPVSQVSPGLAEAYPELADLPLAQFQKIAPILERQDRFQKGLAAQELRYRLMLEGRDLTDAEEAALVSELGMDPAMVKGLRKDVALALVRGEQAKEIKATPGFRFTAAGDLEPIPGGPADIKGQAVEKKDEASRRASVQQADRIISKVDQAIAKVGAFSAGLGANLGVVPGTKAKDLKADLLTIKANLGFAELQAMQTLATIG